MKIMNGLYNLFGVIVFAYLVGSFLNVVISRLPIICKLKDYHHDFKTFNLALPRSHCPHCQHILHWWHNIPLLSFILLKGQCYFCHASIAKRYFIVELSFILLIALCYYQAPNLSIFLSYALFSALALCIFFIDWETLFIPDILNYLLLWSGLLINTHGLFCSAQNAIWGAVIGYLGLWAFYHFIYWTSKKEGFGYGDFKLLAALGAWCGVYELFNILFLASLLGLILALVKLKKMGEPIAFGPALCIAGFLNLVYPQTFNLLNWSRQLFGNG
jgi:leader peptidase (prepilin peptidase)/N-methyltransferase